MAPPRQSWPSAAPKRGCLRGPWAHLKRVQVQLAVHHSLATSTRQHTPKHRRGQAFAGQRTASSAVGSHPVVTYAMVRAPGRTALASTVARALLALARRGTAWLPEHNGDPLTIVEIVCVIACY
eukprot:COSAG01_NODE_15836_length_1294_cov_2.063598_2_plen_124_part_00